MGSDREPSAAGQSATETTTTAGRPVVLVVSPHAGNAAGTGAIKRLLADAGIRVAQTVLVTELFEHQPQGKHWCAAGAAAVIAAGGDGTIGTVATHLAGSGLPMGILPMGTANDIARSLTIPLDLPAAARLIATGEALEVDAGEVVPALAKPRALALENPTPAPRGPDAPEPAAGAYFMHALTLGFNVSFARLATDVVRRQRWGGLTCLTSVFDALRTYRPVPVTLRCLDASGAAGDSAGAVTCEAVQVMAINTPVVGGAMNLRVPGINIHDKMLDYYIVEAIEPAALRRSVEALMMSIGRLTTTARRSDASAKTSMLPPEVPLIATLNVPGIRHFRARGAIIETSEPVDVTMDGELRAHTPVEVRVATHTIRVYAPAVVPALAAKHNAGTTTREEAMPS